MTTVMDKIRILGQNSKYDICASTASSRTEKYPQLHDQTPNWIGSTISSGVCHSYTPDGRCVSLFKVLFTNKCIYDCKYCFTRICKEKVAFTPEEYANTFMKLYMQNIAEGVFLTSAICRDADSTTQGMLKAVQILREKYRFRGYVHFKCLPGTSYSLLKEVVKWADRVSINLEAPTKEHLSTIAEQKDFYTDILTRQRWLKEIRTRQNEIMNKQLAEMKTYTPIELENEEAANNVARHRVRDGEWEDDFGQVRRKTGYLKQNWDNAPILNSGQTTQFILGAAKEPDWDVLKRLDWAYREVDLRRGYFSAFCPIEGTPLEKQAATPLDREHRLYQTDWLLRRYHFPLKDVREILTDSMNLPIGDPKIHLAQVYFGENGAIEINNAPYDQLLRVPGIGPLSAQRIVRMRKQHQWIHSRIQLHDIGVVLKRAEPFIKINGNRQTTLDSYLRHFNTQEANLFQLEM